MAVGFKSMDAGQPSVVDGRPFEGDEEDDDAGVDGLKGL